MEERKTLGTVQNRVNSTMTYMAVQLVQKAWDELTRSYLHTPLRIVIQQYLWLNSAAIQYQVCLQHTDSFAPLKERKIAF